MSSRRRQALLAATPKAFGQAELSHYWVPGQLVQGLGQSSFAWAEQRGTGDDFVQTDAARQPDQTVDNNLDTWSYVSGNDDQMEIVSPSASMRGTGVLYISGWFLWNGYDTIFRFFWEQGVASVPGTRGWFLRKRNTVDLFEFAYTTDGTNFDNDGLLALPVTPGWHFVELVIDPLNANRDARVQVWQDRVQISIAHNGEVIATLHDSNQNIRLGNDNGTSVFDGRVGSQYFVRNTLPTDAARDALFSYSPPTILTVPQSRELIVFDGDSLTAGTGATTPGLAYPIQFRELVNTIAPSWTVFNKGVGSESMANLVTNYPAKVAPVFDLNPGRYDRKIVVVWEAVNGLVDGDTPAEMADDYEAYVTLAKATGWEVYVGTNPPSGGSGNPDLLTLNQLVRDNFVSWGADGLIDFGAISELTPAGNTANPTHYVDLTHLTDVGYALLAELAESILNV